MQPFGAACLASALCPPLVRGAGSASAGAVPSCRGTEEGAGGNRLSELAEMTDVGVGLPGYELGHRCWSNDWSGKETLAPGTKFLGTPILSPCTVYLCRYTKQFRAAVLDPSAGIVQNWQYTDNTTGALASFKLSPPA